MAFPRFYCPGQISTDEILELPEGAAHHAFRVLRLEPGAQLILFNGKGGEFQGIIERIGRSGATVLVKKYFDIERESPLSITLAQAACASEKMDWIVQKGVELGISRIQVLDMKRSLIKLSGERAEKRVRHWQQVAISACEQCGRNRVPHVQPLASLPGWLGARMDGRENSRSGVSPHACFMLSPGVEKGLRDLRQFPPIAAITLLVGPEGGFTPDEEAAAGVAGFIPLSLGPRIFRVETAALAAVAAMQALWGDY
ncbi:MAG TPA: 16S rRNA (uracil(1498)-N(3))-methyltransferase [Nitrosospira sp.]